MRDAYKAYREQVVSTSTNKGFIYQRRLRQLRQAHVFLGTNLKLSDWNDTFHDRVSNGHNRTPGALAFDILRNWKKGRDAGQFVLWLAGPPGRGKTMLARMMATWHCAVHDLEGCYANWTATLETLKASWSDPEQSGYSLSPLYNSDVLILDDIGMERTLWELSQFYRLLEARTTKSMTIVTSNHDLVKTVVDREPDPNVTYGKWLELLRQPQRHQDRTDDRYQPLVARIIDRLRPGDHSYLWASFQLTSPKSYRGNRGTL
jgi:hypothetical protein